MFEITGIIKDVFDTQTFSKGFTKREFILTVRNSGKVEDIKFECHLDKIDLLDDLAQGDLIEVQFYIAGRPWNGNYYNNLVCFDIEYKKDEATEEVTSLSEKEQEEVDEDVPF